MSINVAINMLGGNNVEITSLRTGEAVDLSGGIASITGAVEVIIPALWRGNYLPPM